MSNRVTEKFNSAFSAPRTGEPLSLEKCRKILGDKSPESDAELKSLRDALYGLACVAVEALRAEQDSNRSQNATTQTGANAANKTLLTSSTAFSEALESLPEEVRYEIEERAAILENDSGLTRSAAEQTALLEYSTAQKAKNPQMI